MAKAQKAAEGEEQAPADDNPMLAVLGELGKTMKAIQTQNDTKLALPAEGLFEAKVKGGCYRVGDRLVNCEGEPIDGDDRPTEE